ncbi:hypothetical protein OCU04_009700 [Sclerotinia nivalis]|uniref:Uncharacterized protein n=1 Tax=Sclerotinia nivalis TaxID=352851 RepID=A0A9X0AFM3_9HELO|nr:hypothetical protein OCU04_009700 [Sclerotinia nivalis]
MRLLLNIQKVISHTAQAVEDYDFLTEIRPDQRRIRSWQPDDPGPSRLVPRQQSQDLRTNSYESDRITGGLNASQDAQSQLQFYRTRAADYPLKCSNLVSAFQSCIYT